MGNLWVNVDQIEQVARLLKLPAETVERSWTTFMETARLLGTPWGDDEIGAQWSKVYEPALTTFDGNMRLMVKSLFDLSEGLSVTAGLYGAAEDANLS